MALRVDDDDYLYRILPQEPFLTGVPGAIIFPDRPPPCDDMQMTDCSDNVDNIYDSAEYTPPTNRQRLGAPGVVDRSEMLTDAEHAAEEWRAEMLPLYPATLPVYTFKLRDQQELEDACKLEAYNSPQAAAYYAKVANDHGGWNHDRV
jgi:hypothetical protein